MLTVYPNHTAPRRRLTDILRGDLEALRDQWNTTEAAADFAPLPAGTYECHVHSVELFNAKTGTPGAKIRFDVCEGAHAGRALFHDCWLTAAALPQTKRDLLKLGIDTLDKLEAASLPAGRIRCKVRVTLRRDDDGTQRNRVVRFDVIGIDEPQRDPFAPDEYKGTQNNPSGAAPAAPTPEGDAGDAIFNFGVNVRPEGGVSCN